MPITTATAITKGFVSPAEGIRLGRGQPRPRDIHTPNFELIIIPSHQGQAFGISDEVKSSISEIVYEDNSEQFDTLSIKFENQLDNAGGGDVLSLVDSKLFAEGHRVEVRMGYGESLFTIGVCILVKKTPDFSGSGPITLEIQGFDLLYLLARNRPKGGHTFVNERDSQIASIIGERNGFDISVEDPRSFAGIRKTEGILNRTQNIGESDYEFLKRVADINGFDLFSRFNPVLKKQSLFFQPSVVNKTREVFTFIYNAGEISYKNSLLSFTPTLDAYDQSTDFEIFFITDKKVGGSSFDAIREFFTPEQRQFLLEEKQRIGKNTFQEAPFNDDGVQVGFNAFGRGFKFPPHKRFKNEADATRAIENFIKRQKENFITGTGTLIGNEVVQSRQVHNFEGLGKQFSGKYYFTQVTHTMSKDSGYHTQFSCRKVITDTIVKAIPFGELDANAIRVNKFKKTEQGRSSVINSGVGEGT